MEYMVLKWLHVLSSTLLFGAGLGSAYYMFFASLTRDPRTIAHVVRRVVIADWLFTTTTIVFQPLSGWRMAHLAGAGMVAAPAACAAWVSPRMPRWPR